MRFQEAMFSENESLRVQYRLVRIHSTVVYAELEEGPPRTPWLGEPRTKRGPPNFTEYLCYGI